MFCGCKSPQTVELLSYNIHIGIPFGEKTPKLEDTAKVIKEQNCETIVLNEVDNIVKRSGSINQAKFIADYLGYNYIFGRAIYIEGGEYGIALLSKYEIERIELLSLPASPRESRVALVVKILAPTPYYVVATHLSFEQTDEIEAIRMQAIDKIYNYIKDNNLSPVILMGDLNSTIDSKPVAQLRELGFKVVNDTNPTLNSFPANLPNRLLDYMAIYPANSAKVVDYKVVDDDHTSDHRPIKATLTIE